MKTISRAIGLALILGVLAVGTASASTVPSVARVNWMSYLNHAIKFENHWLDLINDEQFALDNGGTRPVARADLALRNAARGEYRWLINHKPTNSCFAKVYASAKKQWHIYDLAFTDLARFWANYPAVSTAVFNRGLRYYDNGNDMTDKTTALISANNC